MKNLEEIRILLLHIFFCKKQNIFEKLIDVDVFYFFILKIQKENIQFEGLTVFYFFERFKKKIL